jgi:hypothetical protein
VAARPYTLVGLGAYLYLTQDRAMNVVEGGEQMAAVLAAMARAA